MDTFRPERPEVIEEFLASLEDKANEIISDEEQFDAFLLKAENSLELIPIVGTYLSDVPLLISLIKAYKKKEYTEPPISTIIAIVAVLIYVVVPTDLIPDYIPYAGFLDDASAVAFVVEKTNKDLEAYKKWQKENGKR